MEASLPIPDHPIGHADPSGALLKIPMAAFDFQGRSISFENMILVSIRAAEYAEICNCNSERGRVPQCVSKLSNMRASSVSVVSMLCFLLLNCALGMAQQKFSMRVVEVHGEFLGNAKVLQNGQKQDISQYGAGISSSYGTNGIGGILEYDYRRINLSNLNVPNVKGVNSHELYFGIRYLPMRPTLIVGQMGLRLTLGAMVGLDFEPNFRTCLFGGVDFSPIRTVSGVSVNFVYRPGTHSTGGYEITPCWMLRVGIMIGPTATAE